MENLNNKGFSFDLPKGNSSIIKVIGVGGGGNNALKYMYEKGIHGVDFVICNTDAQTLDNNPITNKVQLGVTITEGLGAGADPEVGEKAALESIDDIKTILGHNTKMVFITAGMGGGTGTGAAPVIANIAKEMGILTIAIVTVPFSFEGKRRLDQAESGLEKLRNSVDSLIVINNDKLRQQFGNLGFKSGFSKADEVLSNAAKGMAEVITGYFDVNIDFRDARSVLKDSGTALMSTGIASGENKAEEAVRKALDSPLLNDNKITGAKNVLLLIRSGSEEVTMDEIGVIMDHIQKEAGNTADIIFGVGTDEDLGEEVSVLVIATGFAPEDQKYAGPTETIRYKLDETILESSESILIENEISFFEDKKTAPNLESKNFEKNLFFLEDDLEEMEPTPDFKIDAEPVLEKHQERVMELKFFEEPQNKQTVSTHFNNFEKRVNLDPTFFSNEIFDDETFEIQNVEIQEEIEIQKREVLTSEVNAESRKEEFFPDTEDCFFTEEFKIVDKDEPVNRNYERRDKLKEFNSRYQTLEFENEFETVPAFKRKNINITSEEASTQNISSFLFEGNNKTYLKENKFLNKDVD